MHTARTSWTQNGVLMMNIGTICIQLIKLQMVEEICCRFKHELDHKQTLPGRPWPGASRAPCLQVWRRYERYHPQIRMQSFQH